MNFSEWAVAQVEHEAADYERHELTGRLSPGHRRTGSVISTVCTLRLDNDELAALQARATAAEVPPSVLARNYIRIGLTRAQIDAEEALQRIEAAVAQLRASVRQV